MVGWRYYTVDEFGNKEQIKTELVYDEIQYQDQFVYFSAYILDNKILTYEGSSGMAYTEYGNFTFAGEQLIKTSFGYGTESGTTEIYIDGKKIYEKEQNVNWENLKSLKCHVQPISATIFLIVKVYLVCWVKSISFKFCFLKFKDNQNFNDK